MMAGRRQYDCALRELSEKTGLSERDIDKVYHAYWKAVRRHIESLPLKEGLSDGEFQSLRPNVSIPSLGKLHITLDRYKLLRERHTKGKEDATH